MRRALAEYRISGIRTNLSFHRRLVEHPAFARGDYDTGFIGEYEPELVSAATLSPNEATRFAVALALAAASSEASPAGHPRDRRKGGTLTLGRVAPFATAIAPPPWRDGPGGGSFLVQLILPGRRPRHQRQQLRPAHRSRQHPMQRPRGPRRWSLHPKVPARRTVHPKTRGHPTVRQKTWGHPTAHRKTSRVRRRVFRCVGGRVFRSVRGGVFRGIDPRVRVVARDDTSAGARSKEGGGHEPRRVRRNHRTTRGRRETIGLSRTTRCLRAVNDRFAIGIRQTRDGLDRTGVAETTVRQLRPASVESPARHSAAPSTAASATASLATTSFDTSLPASAVPPPPASVPPSLPPEPPVPRESRHRLLRSHPRTPLSDLRLPRRPHTRTMQSGVDSCATLRQRIPPMECPRHYTRLGPGERHCAEVATIERTVNDVEAFARHAALGSAESAHNLPSHATKKKGPRDGRSGHRDREGAGAVRPSEKSRATHRGSAVLG